jgi:hypothetical protein
MEFICIFVRKSNFTNQLDSSDIYGPSLVWNGTKLVCVPRAVSSEPRAVNGEHRAEK